MGKPSKRKTARNQRRLKEVKLRLASKRASKKRKNKHVSILTGEKTGNPDFRGTDRTK